VSAAGLLVAFGAGALSFLSPCVLPIVPGYLAVLAGFGPAGSAAGSAADTPDRRRMLRNAALFCAGFSAVFVALGLTATAAGQVLVRHQALLTRLGGAAVLLMAVYLLGTLVARSPALYGERRFHPRMSGAVAAPLAGAAFAFGWSPCFGPVLGSVLAVAATQGRAVAGAVLLTAYSAGFAVPFLASGLLYERLTPLLGRMRRAAPAITVGTAAVLVALGVLLVTDQLALLSARLQA
jgi:cytochrome c-type biogenesis protein